MLLEEVHSRQLAKSSELSEFQMAREISPLEVITVLNKAKISFVVVGAYGTAGWRKKARATEEVDVVVASRHLQKAVAALCQAFPHLDAVDLPVVIRLCDRESRCGAVDLMKPIQSPFREVFKHSLAVTSGTQTYRVPTLEMALVMKFAAMIGIYRQDEDKHLDAHDFIRMVKANPDYDSKRLSALGELVYSGGGLEVVELARKARDGEKLIL